MTQMDDKQIDELMAALPKELLTAEVGDIEHALFADAIERQSHSPFWGSSKKIAEFYAAAPTLIRRLRSRVVELEQQCETAIAMTKRWKAAVEGLTPHGSEYVDDPEACAAAIRKLYQHPKMVVDLRARLQQVEGERADALAWKNGLTGTCLEWSQQIIELRTALQQAEAEREELRAAVETARQTIEARTAEIMRQHDLLNQQARQLADLQREREGLQVLLKQCIPHVSGTVAADKMMDGFNPQEHESETLLAQIERLT